MMCAMWSGALPRPSAPMASRAGQPILGSSTMIGPVRRPSRHCSMIFADSVISSMRVSQRSYVSAPVRVGTAKS